MSAGLSLARDMTGFSFVPVTKVLAAAVRGPPYLSLSCPGSVIIPHSHISINDKSAVITLQYRKTIGREPC
jgi:hypothetical protein